jgi:hypothetical protein
MVTLLPSAVLWTSALPKLSSARSHSCDNTELTRQVSDGVIAAGFEPEALAILKAKVHLPLPIPSSPSPPPLLFLSLFSRSPPDVKKDGNYVVLRADPAFVPLVDECKEVFGMALVQKR